MAESPYEIVVNERTHMVVETATRRCLGAAGSNFYRCWVFPLYTPSGLTVIQEFPFDHPFHTGAFVAQHPVRVGGREANFWASPPRRGHEDKLFVHVGRVDAPPGPEVKLHAHGARFVFRNLWRDEAEQPVLDEVRTIDLYSAGDATVCEMISEKIAAYGALEYPHTKFGSIGIRVEPRLLPAFGGTVLADNGRRGRAECVHEGQSEFVAYENDVAAEGIRRRFGVLMHILDPGVKGPWFIRDYGMALYDPTWAGSVTTPAGGSWTISLRIVAYDGPLTDERIARWCAAGAPDRSA